MLLNNYYKLLAYRTIANADKTFYSGSSFNHKSYTIPELRTADGVARTTFGMAGNSYALRPMFSNLYGGIRSQATSVAVTSASHIISNICVGSGTTPAQADDYMLENEITSGLTFVSNYTTSDVANGKITFIKTMRNDSTETMSISEVGMTDIYTPDASSTNYQIMVLREVYNTPIVVAPGESFTVTINVTLPLSA